MKHTSTILFNRGSTNDVFINRASNLSIFIINKLLKGKTHGQN